MSVPSALSLERLFAPGIRLGWTFRDHRMPAAPYCEPPPDPGTLHKQMTERVGITQSRYAAARRWVIKPSLVAGLLLLLVAGYASGTHRATQATEALIAALAVAGSSVGYTIRCWWRRARTSAASPERRYRKLPADLGRCGLLASLSPAQFADALTEAIHAGAPGGARTDRAVDATRRRKR